MPTTEIVFFVVSIGHGKILALLTDFSLNLLTARLVFLVKFILFTLYSLEIQQNKLR